jgi:hypothetical protein
MKRYSTYTMTPESSVPATPWFDTVILWFAMKWWRYRIAILLSGGVVLAAVPSLPWNLAGTGYYVLVAAFGLVCVREVVRFIRLRNVR